MKKSLGIWPRGSQNWNFKEIHAITSEIIDATDGRQTTDEFRFHGLCWHSQAELKMNWFILKSNWSLKEPMNLSFCGWPSNKIKWFLERFKCGLIWRETLHVHVHVLWFCIVLSCLYMEDDEHLFHTLIWKDFEEAACTCSTSVQHMILLGRDCKLLFNTLTYTCRRIKREITITCSPAR